MSAGIGRQDPTGLGGAKAREQSLEDRRQRLMRMSAEPWGVLIRRMLIRTAVVFAVAGTVAWVSSLLRGY